MGFETVAIARGAAKADGARELGAHHYIDSTRPMLDRPSGSRWREGGACHGRQLRGVAPTVAGLGPQGELVVVGVTPENLPISPLDLINAGLSVTGHPSGTARDVEETMHFAVQTGVRPVVEERPLSEAAEAYEAMDTGKARYRMVLTM